MLTTSDWNVEIEVQRYLSRSKFILGQPYDVTSDGAPTIAEGMLTDVGGDRVLSLMCGAGGTTLSNANALLQVGSGTTAPTRADTTLVTPFGSTKACSPGWPKLGVAGGLTVRQAQWRTVYDISEANGAPGWQEFGLFAAGTLIDRFLSNQGTKPATQVWALLLTLTLA